MSNYLSTAVVTTATTVDAATEVMSLMLDLLFEDYELGFRSYGGVMRLAFENRDCRGELPIDEQVAAVSDLDRARLARLVARHHWITVTGSFGIEGVQGALDVKLFTFPTFDEARPACAVAWLDASLYSGVWGDDDEFDAEAADRLRTLMVALGANDHVDGFHGASFQAFADIATFDIATLRDSLLQSHSIADRRAGRSLIHGIVSGISRAALSPRENEALRAKWADAEVLETVNGFLIVNNLLPTPEDDEEP